MVVEEKELDEQIVEDANPQDTDPDKDVTAAEEDNTEKKQDSEEPDDKKEKKKSFLGKDKKEKANKLQEKIDELEDKVKRQMAEFDNFRKRSEKEKSAMFETGADRKSVV